MRRVSFIVTVLGICVLVLMMVLSSSREIFSIRDLEGFEINSLVEFSGVVSDERYFDNGFRIFHINEIEVVCECAGVLGLKEKEVFVEGVVGEFEGERQVEVLSLEIIG
jgi:hypothetical protein